jgi:hypothetical protein
MAEGLNALFSGVEQTEVGGRQIPGRASNTETINSKIPKDE